MKWFGRISLSIVIVTFPLLLIINFVQIAFSNSLTIDLSGTGLDVTNYYFGFQSILYMADDFSISFEQCVKDLYINAQDFVLEISRFINGSYLQDLIDTIHLFDTNVGLTLDNFVKLFVVLFEPLTILYYFVAMLLDIVIVPFAMAGYLILIYFKFILGVYNIPYPPRESYIIPDWHDVWDFTFNLRMLLR